MPIMDRHLIGAALGATATGAANYHAAKKDRELNKGKPGYRLKTDSPGGAAALGVLTGAIDGAALADGFHQVARGKQLGQRISNTALKGAVIGAGLGGWSGNAGAKRENEDARGKKTVMRRDVAANTIAGAVRGAGSGAFIGRLFQREARQPFDFGGGYGGGRGRSSGRSYGGGSGFGRKPPEPPDWLKNVKTKKDAKKAYHTHAMKNHPDRGGSEDAMKKINADWDDFQKHHFDKLSSIRAQAFLDELAKIYGEIL